MNEHLDKATVAAAEAARVASDTMVGKAALGATITGGATAIYGGYTLNEWAMILGAVAAIGGLVFQAYTTYDAKQIRRRKERREEEWHRTRMAALKANRSTPETDRMGIFCDTRESQQ